MNEVNTYAENLGFTIMDTGGGCTALSKTLADDSVLLITSIDGSTIPESTEEDCILERYVDDSLEESPADWDIIWESLHKCFEIAQNLSDQAEKRT